MAARTQPDPALVNYSAALMPLVFAVGIIVCGLVIALAIALRKTESEDRADVVRAVGDAFRWMPELFRWFRRGGPPGAA